MATGRKEFYLDLLERVFWTFGQSFFGTYLASAVAVTLTSHDSLLSNLPLTTRLIAAASAGGIAAAKCFVAQKLPWTASNSASTLPASVDPPQAEDVPQDLPKGVSPDIYETPSDKEPIYPGDEIDGV